MFIVFFHLHFRILNGIFFFVSVGLYKNTEIGVQPNDEIFYFDNVCNQILGFDLWLT